MIFDPLAQAHRPLALSPDSPRRDRPPYAVIDIGSNSVRLVVYDSISRAPLPRFNEKSFCRLAEGLDETGRLNADGMRRTVEALRRFKAIADAMQVAEIDVLATEATRRASNGPDLVAAILRETGLAVRILEGHEEATFATMGVISGFFRPVGLVGDMGGGSLEIGAACDDRVGDTRLSLPLGALPVQAIMARHGSRAKSEIDRILAAHLPPDLTTPTFYPVGGGWRALAQVYMAMHGDPLSVTHGFELPVKTLRAFARRLTALPPEQIARLPGVPSRRADTIACATLVMDRVLKRLSPDRVIFSALGVREGWLYTRLPPHERYLDPLIEGAQAWALPHARVPAFAAALDRWTAPLFPETPADTRLRVAACALSDIAWRDNDALRAAEAFRRVAQFPFIGITHPERLSLATIIHARYAGRADDPTLAAARARLPKPAFRRARILGHAFLVAYRYSGSVPDILATSRLDIGPKTVTLHVAPAARAPDSEALMARLGLLARAVGVKSALIRET